MEPNTLQEQNENLNLDDFERQKKALELKKLAIELEKAEAEKEKVQIEVGRLKMHWFWQQTTFETIGKIILGAGVMAFSYGIFIQPYFTLKEAKLQTQIDSTTNLNKQLSNDKAYSEKMKLQSDSIKAVALAELEERKIEVDSLEHLATKMKDDIVSLSKVSENTKKIQSAISKSLNNMAKTPNTTSYLKSFASRLPQKASVLKLPNDDSGRNDFKKDLQLGLADLKGLSINIFGSTDLVDQFIEQETSKFGFSQLGFTNLNKLPLSVLYNSLSNSKGQKYNFSTGNFIYTVGKDGYTCEAELHDIDIISKTTKQFINCQVFFEGRAHYVLQIPIFRLEQELIKKLHNQRR